MGHARYFEMTNGPEAVYFALFEGFPPMARWQSGDAADCKSVYAGSIPTRASIYFFQYARVSLSGVVSRLDEFEHVSVIV